MSKKINELQEGRVGGTRPDSCPVQAEGRAIMQQQPDDSSTRLDDNVYSEPEPPFDGHRVKQIRKMIMYGSYRVDAASIADKLMQFENCLKP